MANIITALKGRRNVYRRHLKNTEEELSDMLKDFNVDSEEHAIKLVTMHASYSEKFDLIKTIDDELLAKLTEQEEIENELSDQLTRNDIHSEYIVRMSRYIEKTKQPRFSSATNSIIESLSDKQTQPIVQ